jgi:hypothetical protein
MKFLTPEEIEALESLSHYQRIQLELHGNILREETRPLAYRSDEEGILSNQEESYIFSLENSEQ